MKQRHRTYWKAFFLLLVFSLNTVVSFACSLGGAFHLLHHQGVASLIQQGKGLKQEQGKGHAHGHKHTYGSGHKRDQSGGLKHSISGSSNESAGDDCCSGSVVKLEKADKAVAASVKVPTPALEIVFFQGLAVYLNAVAEQDSVVPQHDRWRPPGTIQDLRIAIQSFQI